MYMIHVWSWQKNTVVISVLFELDHIELSFRSFVLMLIGNNNNTNDMITKKKMSYIESENIESLPDITSSI